MGPSQEGQCLFGGARGRRSVCATPGKGSSRIWGNGVEVQVEGRPRSYGPPLKPGAHGGGSLVVDGALPVRERLGGIEAGNWIEPSEDLGHGFGSVAQELRPAAAQPARRESSESRKPLLVAAGSAEERNPLRLVGGPEAGERGSPAAYGPEGSSPGVAGACEALLPKEAWLTRRGPPSGRKNTLRVVAGAAQGTAAKRARSRRRPFRRTGSCALRVRRNDCGAELPEGPRCGNLRAGKPPRNGARPGNGLWRGPEVGLRLWSGHPGAAEPAMESQTGSGS